MKKITCERILNETPDVRERRLARQRAHYIKNKEKYLARYKEKYHQNIEENRKKAKRIRDESTPKQKQKYRAYLKEYRNKPERKIRSKELSQSDKYKYIQYRNQSAKRRNKSFELTFEQFVSFYHSSCYLCGEGNAKGIDRFDNNIGYTVENSRSCCSLCNLIKWKHPHDELLAHISKIAKHRGII